MKSRLAASLVLAAVAIVGATGCTFLTPQSTTLHYEASDGINVNGAGPVAVRNAMIIADETGTAGNFVGALINTSSTPQVVTIQLDGKAAQTVTVLAGELLSFGSPGQQPLPLAGFSGKPGSTATVFFQSGNETGLVTQVPVLDGTLSYYAPLAP